MANKGFPQTQLDNIEPSAVQEIVSSLRQLHDRGKPETDEEVKQRLDDYFSFCEHSSIRPGIESACLSLAVSRQTFFRWSNGEDCSKERAEMIQSAKAFIAAFIEQSMLQGKISPPSGIFLAKNWLGYKDQISIEESIPHDDRKKAALKLPDLRKELQRYADELNQKANAEDTAVLDGGAEAFIPENGENIG